MTANQTLAQYTVSGFDKNSRSVNDYDRKYKKTIQKKVNCKFVFECVFGV